MTTYAGSFLRMTASGVLGPAATPVEIWANNISLRVDNGPLPSTRVQVGAIVDAVKQTVGEFYQGSCTNACGFTRLRIAVVGSNGLVQRDAAGAYLQADATSAIRGSSTNSQPFQIAQVVTLRSAYAGPTGRGRFYVPVPRDQVAESGQIVPTAVGELADRAAFLMTYLNNTRGGYQLRVIVASGGSSAKGIAPAFHPVSSIDVGDVLDTQQRRRRELNESPRVSRVIGAGI